VDRSSIWHPARYTWTPFRAGSFLLVICAVAAWTGTRREAAQQASDEAAWKAMAPQLMADIRLGKLDPSGFQQLCGQPSMRPRRKDYLALLYKDQNVVVMFRRRSEGDQKAEAARQYPYAPYDQASFWEISPSHMLAPEAALEALNCKLR
jgi:hypothetical protein